MVMASSPQFRRNLFRSQSDGEVETGKIRSVQVGMMIVLKHLIDKIYGEIIRCSQPYNTFGFDSIGIPFPLRYCQR